MEATGTEDSVGAVDGERRGWRRQVREALRPERRPAPLSARAWRLDVLLAVVLTVVALVVAVRYPGDGPIHIGPKTDVIGPLPPEPPAPPEPPQVPVVPGTPEAPRPPEPPAPPQPPLPPEAPHPPRFPYPPEEASAPSSATAWLLVVGSALPLAARRRYPLAAFGVIVASVLAMGGDASWINVLTCVIAAYSAVMYSRYRVGAMAALVAAAVLAGGLLREAQPALPGWSSPAVVLLVAGALAGLVRFWRRQLAAGREKVAELQWAQQEATRRAVEEERSRIAAELHDVVTHNVSVMVIQAGAARTVMDAAPDLAKEALLAVEAGGRAAMAELRHVMGLLAAPDHERAEGLEPQPGLAQLDALVERVRAAGIPVEVTVALPQDPLPPGIDLTAYRVVQEALTNTIKHAPGARARVVIGQDGDGRLGVEVTDSGRTREPVGVQGNGRGLIGLRERLALYGGELTAGPAPGGGYRIEALLPWRAA